MTEKADQVVGLITVSIAGITATLAPSDAAAWGSVLMDLTPLGLIAFLIWRVRQMDKQLGACRKAHERVSEQLLLSFAAIKRSVGEEDKDLPTEEEFITGKFNIGECLNKLISKEK